MEKNTKSLECVKIGIGVFPTAPPPPPPPDYVIPAKLLKIMAKYKKNWRLDQLSIPNRQRQKYVPKPDIVEVCKPPKLSEETRFYSDQQSRAPLRTLVINKRLFGKLKGKKYRKKINKHIRKAWESIYNFYKKRARDRALRQLRRDKKPVKKKSIDTKYLEKLATPKKVFKPQPRKKPKKIFTNFVDLAVLASPKTHLLEKPKEIGVVNRKALTYQATDIILKLRELPARYHLYQKPLELGKVRKAALLYKLTPRVEALAVPKARSEKAQEDEDYNPWEISKNALKYKATARILELAKPRERD